MTVDVLAGRASCKQPSPMESSRSSPSAVGLACAPPATSMSRRTSLTKSSEMEDREETIQALVDTVARFVREELIPAEAEGEEADDIPARIVNQLKQFGLFGMTIPEIYGGAGLSRCGSGAV